MRFPTDPPQLAQITRAARQLPQETWDAFFAAVGAFFLGLDDTPGRLPSPADVAAGIEHGRQAVAQGAAVPRPIPMRLGERDPSRPPPRDIGARNLAKGFAGQFTARRRRA